MASSQDNCSDHDNFRYNHMLARALVQLFPEEERLIIHMWLEKLQNMKGDKETLYNRNCYSWVLLLVLRSGILTEPFNKVPLNGELPPIFEIVSPQVYQEMLSSSEQNFSWMDKLLSDSNAGDDKGREVTGIQPHTFLKHQSRPTNGVSCYFSVFSRPQYQ